LDASGNVAGASQGGEKERKKPKRFKREEKIEIK